MKRIIQVSMIITVSLVLAGCSFPSQRLQKIDNCYDSLGRETNLCGASIMVRSELALVKETRGKHWRLWHKNSTGSMNELCTGTIDDDTFVCPRPCNEDKTITLAKRETSFCEYERCVELNVEPGTGCPGGGTGKGGSNDD